MVLNFFPGKADAGEQFFRLGIVGHFTLGAKPANKTLRYDKVNGVRNQEWFNTHFIQTTYRAGSIVGMQG